MVDRRLLTMAAALLKVSATVARVRLFAQVLYPSNFRAVSRSISFLLARSPRVRPTSCNRNAADADQEPGTPASTR